MAVILTAKGIRHSGGTFGNCSQEQNSSPFMYHWMDSGSTTIGGSWNTFMTTPDWQCPPKTQGICYWYLPMRNDGGSWGGCYIQHYIRINNGSWTSMGHSGYGQSDSVMSYNDGGRIDHQCQSQQYDFSGQTSNFTVAFRFDCLHHSSDGSVNGSTNVDGGGNMGTDGYGGYHDASGNWTASGGSTGYSHCAWLGQGYE